MSDDMPRPPTPHPDLLGLLRGELENGEVARAGHHLASCDSCRRELSEMAVGHALLARAGRTLGAAPSLGAAPGRDLPAATPPSPRLGRWTRPLAAVAAVVVLVAGTAVVTSRVVGDGTGAGPLAGPDPGPSRTSSEQSASLAPVSGRGAGKVRMVDHDGTVTMSVEVRDLPRVDRGEFYYAWLFDPGSGKMLALGVVGPGGTARFEVPDTLVGRYQVVDVSLEKDDGDPGHSVTSVLRGTYDGVGAASS